MCFPIGETSQAPLICRVGQYPLSASMLLIFTDKTSVFLSHTHIKKHTVLHSHCIKPKATEWQEIIGMLA